MIELELKYKLTKEPIIMIEAYKKNEIEDIYYDTQDNTLLKKGNFLRLRNQKSLDFKLNANDLSHLYCKERNFNVEKYNSDELEELLKEIGLSISFETIEELLNQLKILAPIKKQRISYKIEPNIEMVIDKVENLGIFLEIEYDICKDNITNEEAKQYKDYLNKILKEKKYITEKDEEIHIGYVELYLKENNPEAFELGLYK